MTTRFLNRHLEELYTTGRSRKYRVQPQVAAKFVRRVDAIKAAESVADLAAQNGLNFEQLRGTNRYSIRVDRKYRLEFTIDWTNATCTVGIAGIVELSNHYGD